MAKSKSTIRKEKFKAKALVRSKAVRKGAQALLDLLARSEVHEVSSAVNSYASVDLMLLKGL